MEGVANSCSHLALVDEKIRGNTEGCGECKKLGSDWVHLRLWLTCGHVGCCDSFCKQTRW